MSHSGRFAISLILLWIGFACFFVAFHPGGVLLNGSPAKNPSDVIKFTVQKLANPGTSSSSATGSSGGVQSA